MLFHTYEHNLSPYKQAFCGLLFLSASFVPFHGAHALDNHVLPTNGEVVGGSADLDFQGNQLDIHQNTDRVVIDWDSFDIGSGAGVEFFQPDSGSIAVNRVVGAGQDPTQVLGSLKANGIVMVLDRNGVVFGESSRVDVGGLVVSTGDIDQDAFMNGADILELNNVGTNGAITLNGEITIADAGLAAFVAPTVVNNGVISARMGRVSLGAGETATLDLYGDGLFEIAADDGLAGALAENSGVINVSSATQTGGKIILSGGNAGVSGTLKADGDTGGGTIHVGGDYKVAVIRSPRRQRL